MRRPRLASPRTTILLLIAAIASYAIIHPGIHRRDGKATRSDHLWLDVRVTPEGTSLRIVGPAAQVDLENPLLVLWEATELGGFTHTSTNFTTNIQHGPEITRQEIEVLLPPTLRQLADVTDRHDALIDDTTDLLTDSTLPWNPTPAGGTILATRTEARNLGYVEAVWCALLVTLLLASLRWLPKRRRARKRAVVGQCTNCGYQLAELTSCPECGTDVAPSP